MDVSELLDVKCPRCHKTQPKAVDVMKTTTARHTAVGGVYTCAATADCGDFVIYARMEFSVKTKAVDPEFCE